VPATERDAVNDPRVVALFERELDRQSGAFRQFEKVRKFVLVTEEFSTANGLLTPTMKVRRSQVRAAYHAQLDALYA
jgi:long-chain acyl-CoA synthetase